MIVMAVPKIQEDMLVRILPGRCAVRTAWPVMLDWVSVPYTLLATVRRVLCEQDACSQHASHASSCNLLAADR